MYDRNSLAILRRDFRSWFVTFHAKNVKWIAERFTERPCRL